MLAVAVRSWQYSMRAYIYPPKRSLCLFRLVFARERPQGGCRDRVLIGFASGIDRELWVGCFATGSLLYGAEADGIGWVVCCRER